MRRDAAYPIMMCLADQETYWYYGRTLYKVAWRLGACVLLFNGDHTKYPYPEFVGEILLMLVKSKSSEPWFKDKFDAYTHQRAFETPEPPDSPILPLFSR